MNGMKRKRPPTWLRSIISCCVGLVLIRGERTFMSGGLLVSQSIVCRSVSCWSVSVRSVWQVRGRGSQERIEASSLDLIKYK